MTRMRKKIMVAGIGLAIALGYLVYAGVKAGRSYYLEVDSFLADTRYHAHRVRLRGWVDKENLTIGQGGMSARFDLLGETQRLQVTYEGTIPDMFKGGAEVVVDGELAPDGSFKASQLLTKCASKYEGNEDDARRSP